jgi:hypothetical protein
MPIANILSLGFLVGLAVGGHAWGEPIHAQPPWHRGLLLSQAPAAVSLNDNCQRVAEGWGTWRVDQRYAFQAGGQSYWFVVARYEDGASRLCLTRSGYAHGVPLPVPELQNSFIGRISQEGRNSSFLIDHRGGNGRSVLITRYRLNLANPSRPQLTALKQWRG